MTVAGRRRWCRSQAALALDSAIARASLLEGYIKPEYTCYRAKTVPPATIVSRV